jgi:hypothetical protein
MLRGVARLRFKFILTIRLRPDPIAQVARLTRMTGKKPSKMVSTPTQLTMNRLSPC